MTSGIFMYCSPENISVDRAARQRRDLTNIKELAESIGRLGLIHPIVLDREYRLIAGERRLEACKLLGWDNIPFQFVDNIDPKLHRAIELEENIKRQDISWQDRTRAIEALHNLHCEDDPEWSPEKTSIAVGLERSYLTRNLEVAKRLSLPEVYKMENFTTALNFIERTKAREKDLEEASLGAVSVHNAHSHIQHAIFNEEWLTSYADSGAPKFNFIHCDFPYGIEFHKMGRQANATGEKYHDDFNTYENCLATLRLALNLIADEACHVLFWYSIQHHQFTLDRLRDGTGLDVNPFPLIWIKSDNVGILPDPSRGPRRIYETAFLASRGDRQIVQARSNAFSGPTTNLIHPHEKSEEMLMYFLSMFVDKTSVVLDPTCGGGSALRAAHRLGAPHVLGLEKDETYARLANLELEKILG